MAKKRLDVAITEQGLAESRQKAQAIIMAGQVFVNGQKVDKAGAPVPDNAVIEVRGKTLKYVSRGGLKLEKAMQCWPIVLENTVCADIGASTGGFTDCLLQKGACKVFAIDSGTNQLSEQILKNEKVISLENYNARNLNFEDIGELADIITIDVSFISQNLIIPSMCKLLKEDGCYLSLIKPQFETNKASIGKGGIVKDKKARLHAVASVIDCASNNHLNCFCFIKSPIQGGDGNTEYFAAFSKNTNSLSYETIKKIVLE